MNAQNRRRLEELTAEVQGLMNNPNISAKAIKARMDAIESEAAEIEAAANQSQQHRATFFVGPGDVDMPFSTKDLSTDPGLSVKTKGSVPRFKSATVSDATTDQWYACWEAAQRGQSYRFEVQPSVTTKDWRTSGDNVRAKAALTGGSFGGLPAVIEPGLTQQLPYEPNRLFDSFIQMQMGAPTIEYLVHSGNTQPAAVVAELGTKPDVGIQIAPRTATATKIAGLASTSWELFRDFPTFASFVPTELGRAVVDAETDWIISAAVTGLIWQTGTLTRLVGSDTPLDAIEKAVDDIRVGPMFAKADTIVLHPNTFGYLKRQKTTLGSYVLAGDPKTGLVDTIWDLKVIETTKLPMNYAIVFDSTVAIIGFTRQSLTVDMNFWSDTAWTTNQVLWRAEERIAVAYQKPKAINIVTGFPGAGS